MRAHKNKPDIFQLLAAVLSTVFSPVVLLPLLSVLFVFSTPMTPTEIFLSFTILFGLGILPLGVTLFFFKQQGIISDFDISIRKERYLFNAVAFAISLVVLLVLRSLAYTYVFHLLAIIFMWFACFSVITFFWKISAHTGLATLSLLIITHFYPSFSLPGLLIICSLAWARVIGKHHTVLQTLGGILLSVGVYFLAQLLKLI